MTKMKNMTLKKMMKTTVNECEWEKKMNLKMIVKLKEE